MGWKHWENVPTKQEKGEEDEEEEEEKKKKKKKEFENDPHQKF